MKRKLAENSDIELPESSEEPSEYPEYDSVYTGTDDEEWVSGIGDIEVAIDSSGSQWYIFITGGGDGIDIWKDGPYDSWDAAAEAIDKRVNGVVVSKRTSQNVDSFELSLQTIADAAIRIGGAVEGAPHADIILEQCDIITGVIGGIRSHSASVSKIAQQVDIATLSDPELSKMAIRENMKAENDAVLSYDKFIQRMPQSSDIRHGLEDIRDEEKKHLGELWQLMLKLDPKEAEQFDAGGKEVTGRRKVIIGHDADYQRCIEAYDLLKPIYMNSHEDGMISGAIYSAMNLISQVGKYVKDKEPFYASRKRKSKVVAYSMSYIPSFDRWNHHYDGPDDEQYFIMDDSEAGNQFAIFEDDGKWGFEIEDGGLGDLSDFESDYIYPTAGDAYRALVSYIRNDRSAFKKQASDGVAYDRTVTYGVEDATDRITGEVTVSGPHVIWHCSSGVDGETTISDMNDPHYMDIDMAIDKAIDKLDSIMNAEKEEFISEGMSIIDDSSHDNR